MNQPLPLFLILSGRRTKTPVLVEYSEVSGVTELPEGYGVGRGARVDTKNCMSYEVNETVDTIHRMITNFNLQLMGKDPK